MYVCMYVCVYVYMCVCMYVCTVYYVYVYVCIYICICMYSCMYTCMYVRMYTYVCVFFTYNWRVSEASETLSGVTQLKIRDIFCLYMCVDVHMSFCTLTLAFLCLLRGLPLPITPLNWIFWFSDHLSFKEINRLPLRIRLFLNATRHT